MSDTTSRAKFFRANPGARAIAALNHAVNRQKKTTPGAIKIKKDQFANKTAVVIGSGVGGLTTAFELLAQHSGMHVTVLEALGRTGGRCLTLRTGDTITEDKDSRLFDSEPGQTQVVRFRHPAGDAEPYLNAGPGRIPSSHKRLLGYLKRFGVDVEVYVMNSESNLTQLDKGAPKNQPFVYRRLDHNTRGRLAELVFANAESLLENSDSGCAGEDLETRVEQLRDLMVTFGELENDGSYRVSAGEDGMENGHTRAGYEELPGVSAGKIAEALSLNHILETEFWDKTRFYQPVDFLWQSTLFQPVGGMDQVQRAFAQHVAAKGGTIHLNSPVKEIDWCPKRKKFIISVSQIGTDKPRIFEADYCFSNAAMPFLERMLSPRLKAAGPGGLEQGFVNALDAVFQAQFHPSEKVVKDAGYPKRFLACTTKVGWQAERNLWQGSEMCETCGDHGTEVVGVPDSEVGVVPIFGGISWTAHAITQVWYPSNDYHDELGVLTGAYNFSKTAFEWGHLPVDQRLKAAKEGASGFGERFSDGLQHGVSIAWQNMPHIKGGWAQWDTVERGVDHFNTIAQGSGICDDQGQVGDPCFFIVGDQISSLPGWQEGAIASALNALSRACRPDLEIPYLAALPDTRLMVEGI